MYQRQGNYKKKKHSSSIPSITTIRPESLSQIKRQISLMAGKSSFVSGMTLTTIALHIISTLDLNSIFSPASRRNQMPLCSISRVMEFI